MAQTVRHKEAAPERRYQGEGEAVSCPAAGDTTIASIGNPGKKLLCFHFNVATQALDNFDVLVKAHRDATAVDLTPADWTVLTAGGRFLFASGDLAAVAAAASGYFEMDVTGLDEIIVKASGAVNNASVTPRWTLS